MQRMIKVLSVVYDKLHFHKWDNCLIVVGDEGTGKTNFVLDLMDVWYKKKYGEVKPELINRLGMSSSKFAYALKIANKGDLVDYDESGELSNKRQLNNFNYLITSSYQVIRNENLFTVLTIPDLFELNPFFTKRRARGLVCVYARGKLAYWNRPSLRKIIDYNASAVRKSVWRVKPLFYDVFPEYKGPLLAAYEAMKDEHTKKVKEDIYNKLQEKEKPKIDRYAGAMERLRAKYGSKEAAEIFGVTSNTVNRIIREKSGYQEQDI